MKRGRQNEANGQAVAMEWKDALSYWRRIGPDSFDDATRAKLASTLRDISSTIPEWRSALEGDVAAVSGLALKLRHPIRKGMHTDIVMSVLVHVAFENATAALVLAHTLRRMPLPLEDKARLSALWSLHRIWLEERRGSGN